MRKDLDDELCLVVTKLEGEKRGLESQLSEAKREVGSLSSALQSQQDENRRLMGKVTALEQHQNSELEDVRGSAGGVVSQTLENILASQTRLQLNRQTLQHEQLDSLQRALDTAKVDNKRLTQSLEQVVLTNSKFHSKLEQTRDQYQATIALRDEELSEAWTKLKMAVKDSNRSGDLSKANQELHQRVSELEWQVSKQRACIREQRRELRQQQKSRDLRDGSQKLERFEESITSLHEEEQADSKLQQVWMDSQQVLRKREAEWERWTSTIQRWEAKKEQAHIAGGSKPVRTRLITQSR